MIKTLLFITGAISLLSFNHISALTPDFDLELRAGRPRNADWEAGLRIPSGNPVSQGNQEWVSGTPLHWKLDYDQSMSKVTFFWGLDGNTPDAYLNSIDANVVLSDKNSLKLWTKNSSRIGTNGSMVTDLISFSNGGSPSNLPSLSVVGPNQFEEYIIPQDISGSFTIRGRTTLTWEGSQPTGSHAQLHITTGEHVGTVAVPEPSTIILIGASAAIAGKLRRRKSKKS